MPSPLVKEAVEIELLSRPSQIRFIRPAQMEIFAKVVCFPPLGQLTVIAREQREIEFTVLLEASNALPEVAWEVSVWHNCTTTASNRVNRWEELPLAQSPCKIFGLPSDSSSNFHRYSFTAALTLVADSLGDTMANFTIKFRAGPNVPWQWVKDQFGISDGSLLIAHGKEDKLTSLWASSIFGDNYLQQWNITSLQSQAPGASLFNVVSVDPIPRKSVDDAKYESTIFGSSHVGFARYMALVRVWTPWLAPRHGDDRFHITEDALFCSFLTREGQHVVLLPLNGVNDTVTVFRSDHEGHIIVAARNDGKAEGKFEFLAAISDDFEVANAAVMYEARQIILRNRSSIEQTSLDSMRMETDSDYSDTVLVINGHNLNVNQSEPKPQWLEDWYDGLTYCTWNSLGQDLTAEKIFVALDDLADNHIQVSGLIIDDNWQSLDGTQGETSQFHRGWTDFEANKEGFPDGLKSFVTRLKAKYPAINNIAVWHGLHGYWGGISPTGTIAKNYKIIEVEKQPGIAGGKFITVDPSDIHRLYDDFYRFLSSCGVTSVKTDVQFYLDLLASTPDRRAFSTAYQTAWTTAHLRHFAGKAISCMSQTPQILFHSFLPVNTPRILLRNSDDFFPTIPASHPWHIFCNAHNALFVQHLNVLPDWDMFQTSHPYSSFHAAARCLSGGPIYITDTPFEHDLHLIKQITAKNVRGQTVILRPSVVGKAISIYDPYHEGQILKIGAYNGAAQTGSGILGLFNVSNHETSALIPITDFPGINAAKAAKAASREDNTTTTTPTPHHPSGRILIRSHLGQISLPIQPRTPPPASNLTSITLPMRGYDILTAYPIYDLPILPRKENDSISSSSLPTTPTTTSVAILGLVDKMTGACAIVSTSFEVFGADNNRKLRIDVRIKALGELGIWFSNWVEWDVESDFLVMMKGQVVPRKFVRGAVRLRGRYEVGDDDDDDDDDTERMKGGVVNVDVLGAWEEMGLDAGWSNEVTVGVLIQGK